MPQASAFVIAPTVPLFCASMVDLAGGGGTGQT